MPDAFSEIPIFIGPWAEDQWKDLQDIDSTFLILNLLLNMEGHDFPRKRSWLPKEISCFTLHSIWTGHSSIKGGLTFWAVTCFHSMELNLSVSLPVRTPQASTFLTISADGRLTTNSLDCLTQAWEYLSANGNTDHGRI